MTCPRCRTRYHGTNCPRCDGSSGKESGTFHVSTILIATRIRDHVYRSVEEVPAPLRTQLLKSTNGTNSATILIADSRGRREIARALRHLPGAAQRRLMRAMLGDSQQEGGAPWLTPARRRAIIAIVALLAIAAVGLVCTKAG
jgi:hypothetical protein